MNGCNSLHYVAESEDSEEIMKLLVKYKADINAKDKSEKTPLYRAVFSGNLTNVQTILDMNADVSSTSELTDELQKKSNKNPNVEKALNLLMHIYQLRLSDSISDESYSAWEPIMIKLIDYFKEKLTTENSE